MKYLNKIIEKINSIIWLGYFFGALYGAVEDTEVVITEFFIIPYIDSAGIPDDISQYIELYNRSDEEIDVSNWKIKTYDENDIIETCDFVSALSSITINPKSYFLISNYNNQLDSDLDCILVLNAVKGEILLVNDSSPSPMEIDRIPYDSTWTFIDGHSLRLHDPDGSNQSSINWSPSPITERSELLYEDENSIRNFGSPGEENSFRLKSLALDNSRCYTTQMCIIEGDYNNIYYATDHNYDDEINFSWHGTFDVETGQSYKIIIDKLDSWKPEKHGYDHNINDYSDSTNYYSDSIVVNLNVADTDTSIKPSDLSIHQLELANYSWRVELTKENDIVYSDINLFTINASDYGIYGCVDNGSCKVISGFSTCPTSAEDDTLNSNYPAGCTPGLDCFQAFNYFNTTNTIDDYESANIWSDICQYGSLSIPEYILGNTDVIDNLSVYLDNRDGATINTIEYTFSIIDESIITYVDNSELLVVLSPYSYFIGADTGNNSYTITIDTTSTPSTLYSSSGVINYLGYNLGGEQVKGLSTDLTLSNYSIHSSDIKGIDFMVDYDAVKHVANSRVIAQTEFKINGQIEYFSPICGESSANYYDISNVNISLIDEAGTEIHKTSTHIGAYEFENLHIGTYDIDFTKDDELGGINPVDFHMVFDYLKGDDITESYSHIGYLGGTQWPTKFSRVADVTLDGNITWLDLSRIAQRVVGFDEMEFNDIQTHWVFDPNETIDYSLLLADDDTSRFITGYRLGDVNGDWDCDNNTNGRYKEGGNYTFKNILLNDEEIITLPIVLDKEIHIPTMYIEIKYEENKLEPVNFEFNAYIFPAEQYESVTNLKSIDGVKSILWTMSEPTIINSNIGEISFKRINGNEPAKIWFTDFTVNNNIDVGGFEIVMSDGSREISKGVIVINEQVPTQFTLSQNYPNPFNPQTSIRWIMPSPGEISVDIYNIRGQLIENLVNEIKETGKHELIWNASIYPSGIYIYRLTTGESMMQKKMILLK